MSISARTSRLAAGSERIFDEDLAKRGDGTALLLGQFAEFEREPARQVDVNGFARGGAAGSANRSGHIADSPLTNFAEVLSPPSLPITLSRTKMRQNT